MKSVARRLGDDEQIVAVAFMWQRHRLMLPFAVAAALGVLVVSALVGFEGSVALAGLSVAGAAVAAMATTDYAVLARTGSGLVLMRGSRIRQTAVELSERLPASCEVESVDSTLVLSTWLVGDRYYTVPKSSESAMTRIAAGR